MDPARWEQVLDGGAHQGNGLRRGSRTTTTTSCGTRSTKDVTVGKRSSGFINPTTYGGRQRQSPDRLRGDARAAHRAVQRRLARRAPEAGGGHEAPIAEAELLDDYDSYYYSRGRADAAADSERQVRDQAETWVYVDPEMSQSLASIHRLDRVERWLYNGLHSLDFSASGTTRPLWDIVMLMLLVGGLISSTIGLYLGVTRVLGFSSSFVRGFAGAGRLPSDVSVR